MTISRILNQFCKVVPLVGSRDLAEPPLILPTTMGTFKRSTLGHLPTVSGNLMRILNKRVAVVGFNHYPYLNSPFVARSLCFAAKRGGVEWDCQPIIFPNIIGPEESQLSPLELATLFQKPSKLGALIDALCNQAQARKFEHFLLPPILGLSHWQNVYHQLNQQVSASELLSPPPATAGIRLQYALDTALDESKINLIQDQVVDYQATKMQLKKVTLKSGKELSGDFFILATGKFVGGGLSHKNWLKETIFNLPVWIGHAGPHLTRLGAFVHRSVVGPHPIFSAGLRVDAQLRPLTENGFAAWPNLFAAGSVLGGYEPIWGRSGLACAIVTGSIAGMLAAGQDIEHCTF